MLIVFLFAFVTAASAQRYYMMYYEDTSTSSPTRHYLAISEDGNSLTKETTLSLRCLWTTDNNLNTALNVEKNKGQTPSTPVNTYNESSRKALRSAAFSTKYLVQNSSHVEKTQPGTVLNLALGTAANIRWLMDNDDKDTPVLYYYYYKHYVYNDAGIWKYSTIGDKQATKVKIETYSVFPPHISIVLNGNSYQVTMSAQNGCTIHYTTDGSTPTASSTSFTPFAAPKGATVKAIAYDGMFASSVAEMILPANETVALDDREDHSWTYYSGVDDNYGRRYAGKLYSPNPSDVMITYDGKGGAVSINEPETIFVYKKTLECKTVGTGSQAVNTYPYTVISNPFSKRPAGKGFGGWKIVSGGIYIQGHNNNDILTLDEEIVFENLEDNKLNEIKFEATWVPAKITYLTSLTGTFNEETKKYANDYIYSEDGGTYETNFLVLNCNPASITAKSPCTITMVEPDGSVDYRGMYTFTGSITPMPGAEGRTRIEFAQWNPIANIDARGRNFTIGRGMRMNGGYHLYGTNQLAPVDQILKVESGKFNSLAHYANNGNYDQGNINKQWVTLGCDYDRAKDDNSKLEFTHRMYVGYTCSLNLSSDQEMCRVYGLSGKFMTQVSKGSADWEQCYYMSVSDKYNKGHRYLEIQGGEWLSVTGGTDHYDVSDRVLKYDNNDKDKPSFTFRMKGGHVKGSVYGAAAFYDAVGARTFVITGGTINGWVAGGANGTRENGGAMIGASYVYVGGNAVVDSRALDNSNPDVVINRAVGGNVFGAGCGYNKESSSGQVTEGTNVVIADEAYVERGVYGGGSYGYTVAASNIYITGGEIGGKVGGVNGLRYDSEIKGGVFGGACQNNGGDVNMCMTGGTVYGGIYGGSNASGTINGDVNIKIYGGTIGASGATANVHGGGYGSATAVNGNVSLTLDKNDAADGVAVYGDVYGGSALGVVNNAVSGKTEVTLNSGTINGCLYGGGLGETAIVTGNPQVLITGGTVGCAETVDGKEVVRGDVFGGGNAAAVNGNTNVTITGGEVKRNVYGGGNKAAVSGTTNVIIGQGK